MFDFKKSYRLKATESALSIHLVIHFWLDFLLHSKFILEVELCSTAAQRFTSSCFGSEKFWKIPNLKSFWIENFDKKNMLSIAADWRWNLVRLLQESSFNFEVLERTKKSLLSLTAKLNVVWNIWLWSSEFEQCFGRSGRSLVAYSGNWRNQMQLSHTRSRKGERLSDKSLWFETALPETPDHLAAQKRLSSGNSSRSLAESLGNSTESTLYTPDTVAPFGWTSAHHSVFSKLFCFTFPKG